LGLRVSRAFDLNLGAAYVSENRPGLGFAFLAPGECDDLVAGAIVMLAGWTSEQMYSRGGDTSGVRLNWFRDDEDTRRARFLLEGEGDSPKLRGIVELRTKSLLFIRWGVVMAVAEEIERRGIVLGDRIDQLCREAGISKAGKTRARPFDPSTRHAIVGGTTVRDKQGHPVSLRRRANVLDEVGFNQRLALKLVAEEKGKE
jgi:hypothetical protein